MRWRWCIPSSAFHLLKFPAPMQKLLFSLFCRFHLLPLKPPERWKRGKASQPAVAHKGLCPASGTLAESREFASIALPPRLRESPVFVASPRHSAMMNDRTAANTYSFRKNQPDTAQTNPSRVPSRLLARAASTGSGRVKPFRTPKKRKSSGFLFPAYDFPKRYWPSERRALSPNDAPLSLSLAESAEGSRSRCLHKEQM